MHNIVEVKIILQSVYLVFCNLYTVMPNPIENNFINIFTV